MCAGADVAQVSLAVANAYATGGKRKSADELSRPQGQQSMLVRSKRGSQPQYCHPMQTARLALGGDIVNAPASRRYNYSGRGDPGSVAGRTGRLRQIAGRHRRPGMIELWHGDASGRLSPLRDIPREPLSCCTNEGFYSDGTTVMG